MREAVVGQIVPVLVLLVGVFVGLAFFGQLYFALTLVGRLLVVGFSLVFGTLLVIAIRFLSDLAEFDRVGSDLSLYGYGIALSFVFGLLLERPVLHQLPGGLRLSFFFVFVAGVLSLIGYGINFKLSQMIRGLSSSIRFRYGLNSFELLIEAWDAPRPRAYLILSLIIGSIPTLILVVSDVFFGG